MLNDKECNTYFDESGELRTNVDECKELVAILGDYKSISERFHVLILGAIFPFYHKTEFMLEYLQKITE